jgi:hypothetical protein
VSYHPRKERIMRKSIESKIDSIPFLHGLVKYILVSIILIFGIFSIIACEPIPFITPTKVYYIPIKEIPCYFSNLMWFEFKINTPKEALKREDPEFGRNGGWGWASGRVHGEIGGTLKLKVAMPPDMSLRTVISGPLKVLTDLSFKVYHGKDDTQAPLLACCIDKNRSDVNYSSFDLQAGFLDQPAFMAAKALLINAIKNTIRNSIEKDVLNYASVGQYEENPSKRPNIYCDTDQSLPQPSCECP